MSSNDGNSLLTLANSSSRLSGLSQAQEHLEGVPVPDEAGRDVGLEVSLDEGVCAEVGSEAFLECWPDVVGLGAAAAPLEVELFEADVIVICVLPVG